MTKFKKSKYDKTKTENVTKFKNSKCEEEKIKNSKCDKTQKIKM